MNRMEKIEAGKATMLQFLREIPAVIPENSQLAGFSRIKSGEYLELGRETWDNLHFSMGTAWLEFGFAGVAVGDFDGIFF